MRLPNPLRASVAAAILIAAGIGVASAQMAPDFYPIAGSSQFGLTPTSVLTGQLVVPAVANFGRVCVRTAEVETTEDGSTPTTAPRGTALAAGSCTLIPNHALLVSLKMISATGTVDVEYFQ